MKGARALTTVEVEEALHEILSDSVGEHVQVVMKALNKRGTMRLDGPIASVHRHGFVVGDTSHRLFVAFSDLFCQSARIVEGPVQERLRDTLRELRQAQTAAAS
jgi:hypothetical protein